MPALTRPKVLDAGDAWLAADDGPAAGAVCGLFRLAAYLRFGSRILALCSPEVAAGPLHLRLERLPVLALGEPATLVADRLEVGSGPVRREDRTGPPPLSLDLTSVRRWAPAPVDPVALRRAAARVRFRAAAPLAAAVGLTEPVLATARSLLTQAGDLTALARLVGGRGPGLTPAGDDLLAGALVADAVLRPAERAERHRAAEAARTNDVAAAFLGWAAAGRCIQPVHDVLSAMAAGDAAREEAARVTLSRIGASSGTALLVGLDLALAAVAARSPA